MKKERSRLCIRVFYCLILAPAILWGILTVFGAAKKLDFDTGEKRNKHQLEINRSFGNLTNELELYYNDRVPFRSILLTMNSKLNWFVELPYSKGIQPGLIAWANASMNKTKENAGQITETAETYPQNETAEPEDKAASAESASQANTPETAAEEAAVPAKEPAEESQAALPSDFFPYVELAPTVIQGRDGFVFLKAELPDYQGANMPSDQDLEMFTNYMQTLKNLCDSRGQELYFIALPNKSTVYYDKMPSIDKTGYCAVQNLEDYVHAHSDVRFEFIDQEIIAAKEYGKLYYFNDTHWNGRGALAAVATIHRILGTEEIDIGSLAADEGTPFDGDLIDYSGLPKENFAEENTVDFYYKMDTQLTMVQGLNDTIDEYYSDSPDGRTLVFVGDSYRHHLMPYLSKDFAHTYFINNEVLSADCLDILNSADILIVEDIERTWFSHERTRKAMENLIAIMSN